MSNSVLKTANRLFKEKKYDTALQHYAELLSSEKNRVLHESILFNINICKRKMAQGNGSAHLMPAFTPNSDSTSVEVEYNTKVESIEQAVKDLTVLDSDLHLRPGITALIRAKNASRFITGSIESIADIVDEIVAVDNNSNDGTFEILQSLQEKFQNLRVFQYNIEIPNVGIDHAKAVEVGSQNTLGTYYNWCLSKVRTINVLKWDADFIAIRKNLKELIEMYDLKKCSSNMFIWCKGITSYYGKILNLSSWYDEYRIFSLAHGTKWENYKGCETLYHALQKAEKTYIYGFFDESRKLQSEQLEKQKATSKPIFVELKDSVNVKDDSMVIDTRDVTDNFFIKKYQHLNPHYFKPNKINEYRVIITIPSLTIGGGNYWAKLIYDQISYIGISVDIGVWDAGNDNKFYDIPAENIIILNDKNKFLLSQYSHAFLSAIFFYDDYLSKECNVFLFTHSDVSYINKYALEYKRAHVVGLSDTICNKFRSFNRPCKKLTNCLSKSENSNNKMLDIDEIHILYCNRISFDKNVAMLLYAYKIFVDKYPHKSKLTLLCGGAETSPIEFTTIIKAINHLHLNSNVSVLKSQKNVEEYYLKNDFCVLSSVSEGCSYGLLEAINFEIPIITTNIPANTEITKSRMPVFDLPNINHRSASSFSIDNYLDYLFDIGYVNPKALGDNSSAINEFALIYRSFVGLNDDPLVYIPFLIPEAEVIKSNNDFTDFIKYFKKQFEIFEAGANNIAKSMHEMVINFSAFKEEVKLIKNDISGAYFSIEENRKQLYDVLFSDDFIFEYHNS